MKHKFVTFLLALSCIFGLGAISACVYDTSFLNSSNDSSSSTGNSQSSEEPHAHDFNISKKDSTSHWLECTCGEKGEKVAHTFVEGVCSCGAKETNPTEGLEYTLSEDESYYILSGIGTATDTDIVIPVTYNNLPVIAIGDEAFNNCESITSIVIHKDIISIGADAFVCRGASNSVGGSLVIKRSRLESVVFAEDSRLTIIEERAFYGCESLTSIEIPKSVTTIGDNAFAECTDLTSIEIPKSVTTIGVAAFLGCSSLTRVIIPDGVTSIGDNAFLGCNKLVEVVNKSSLPITAGNEEYGYIAYYAKQVITDEKDSNIIKENDYIFYNDNGSYYLLGYTGKKTELVLPDTINGNTYAIYQFAFYNCDSITSITIPDSVTSIGDWAFSNCDSLTSIIIPDSVTSIGKGAFFKCQNLTSVTFENTNDWEADSTALSSIDLADSEKAAEYLIDTYAACDWMRSDE